MELSDFHALLTAPGQSALAAATALGPTEPTFLTCFETLRKAYPAALAKAALETALLRIRARAKFAAANKMYFTREALEQATSEPVARHRAARFASYGHVADLCCGIGGDALALAAVGLTVDAVDTDPLRAAMTIANATALGVADRVRGHTGDALMLGLPDARAAFADPDRRTAGRRYLAPEDYTPPLSAVRGRWGPDFPLAVKIAPGVAQADLRAIDAEAEFVSLNGELKECVLWFGAVRTTSRRATVLPTGDTLFSDHPRDLESVAPIGTVLYDPDPAVARAGLVHDLGDRLGAGAIDATVHLLTAERHTPTPFATAFAVEHAAPFHVKLLRDYLRKSQVGRVTIVKRGSPADADDLMRKLKLDGPHHRTVFLTRADGAHAVIVGRRIE